MTRAEQEYLNSRVRKFVDWYMKEGHETINSLEVVKQIGAMKEDANGDVMASTVGPLVKAMMGAMELANSYGPPHKANEMFEYVSLDQKGVMLKTENVDTPERFDEIYEAEIARKDVLFRGVREARWALYSSLQRNWLAFDRLQETETDVPGFLERLVGQARSIEDGALPKHFRSIGVDPESDMAVLSFLQHYGAPTPIQDWTYNFHVALFFALDDVKPNAAVNAIDRYCSVYHIEQRHLEDGNLKALFEQAYQETAPVIGMRLIREGVEAGEDPEFIKEAIASGKFSALLRQNMRPAWNRMASITGLAKIAQTMPLLFLADKDDDEGWSYSMNNNPNIHNQKGVFIWNGHDSEPFENVGRELHEADHGYSPNYRFCHSYNFSKDLETHIRARLTVAGITKDKIYPEEPVLGNGVGARELTRRIYSATRTTSEKTG